MEFARILRARGFLRGMKLRAKMMLLAVLVLGGFALSLALGTVINRQVQIGGRTYNRIQFDRTLLEQVALQKADLTQVRTELASLLDEQDQDVISAVRGNINTLQGAIDQRFADIFGGVLAEDKKLALEDARLTWKEFFAAIEADIVPAVRAGQRDQVKGLVQGVQQRRYQRFNEQMSSMVDLIRAEIGEQEKNALTLVDRLTLLSLGLNGALFLLVVLLLWSITRSITTRIEGLNRFTQGSPRATSPG